MVHMLENIGRESHTYLYHMYHNYKRLADVTIFTQGDVYNNDGSAPPHTSIGPREMKRRALKLKAGEVMALGDRRRRFVDWNGIPWEKCQAHAEWLAKRNGQEMTRAERTPGEVWADAIGEAHPYAVYWTEGAVFAVRAETVRQWPRDFYKKLLQMFSGVNEETGHYMERFWYAIFSERYIEWHPNKRREEDKEVVTCKLPDCKAHGVPRPLPSRRRRNGRKWGTMNEALVDPPLRTTPIHRSSFAVVI